MTHLLKKNISIHKYQWFLYLGLLIFFMMFNKDAIFIISLVSAIIITNEFYFDEKANGDKLWNSLPFTRNEIVGSRYISLLIATILSTVSVLIIELIISGTWELTFWKQIIGAVMLMMISGAVFLPILYWLTYRKVIFPLLLIYVLLVIGGSYLFYYSYLYIQDAFIVTGIITDQILFSTGILVCIVVYLASWIVSVKLYNKRDIF